MEINEALRRFREHQKIEQAELAKVLNTYRPQISLYETGKREMKSGQIKAICEHYNVSADYLLGLTDEYRPLRCGEDETAADGSEG